MSGARVQGGTPGTEIFTSHRSRLTPKTSSILCTSECLPDLSGDAVAPEPVEIVAHDGFEATQAALAGNVDGPTENLLHDRR